MTSKRSGMASVVVLCLVTWLIPTTGNGQSPTAKPGDLIVAFENEQSAVLEIEDCMVTSIYPALNDIFAEYDLQCARPLFQANSLMKNVYLLTFPPETDLSAVGGEIQELDIMRHTCVNVRIPGEVVDYVPCDWAINHDDSIYIWPPDGRNDQWTYYMMQVDRAWDITKGDSSIIVAVLDTGIDWEHPDLVRNLWINADEDINENGRFDNSGWNQGGDLDSLDNDGNGFVDDVVGWDFHCQNYYNPNDPDSVCPDPCNPQHRWDLETGIHHPHGSQMASIISAVTDNDSTGGMAGIAWKAKLMGVRCAEYDPLVLDIFEGTQYAIDNGADFLNMSFTIPLPDSGLQHVAAFAMWHELLTRAREQKDILTITSADDKDLSLAVAPERYPNIWPEVICVAAVDTLKKKTVYSQSNDRHGSNYGGAIDICAPACASDDLRGIVTCVFQPQVPVSPYPGSIPPHNFWGTTIATSGACAEVTGTLALLKSFYPEASADFLEAELRRGAMSLHPQEPLPDSLGAGVVNAYRSLTQWGTISQNTTWSNAVYVSGDLTVAPGKTLTITPGTTIYIAADDNEHTGDYTSRIEFNVEGFLDVNGTQANPVVFRSWAGESTEDWVGFYFDSESAGGSFDYCTIKHAEYAIESWVDPELPISLNHCTIDSCRYAGVVAYYGDVTIENSVVSNSGTFGIYNGAAEVTLISSTVKDNTSTGVVVQPNASLTAVGTSFLDNDKGLYVAANASPVVVDASCVFKHNDIGIHAYSSSPEISNSVIDSNSTDGIYCQYYSGPTIQGNDIRYNRAGIYCFSSSEPLVRWNAITYNGEGVAAASNSDPDLGFNTDGNNQFQFNTGHHVSNLTEGVTINALNNYWGNQNPPCFPKASKIIGSVAYDPALCANPLLVSPAPEEKQGGENLEAVPRAFALGAAVPNPFNPTTTIHYEIPRPGGVVDLRIYNVAGQLVRVLVNEFTEPGYKTAIWDGRDNQGVPVASSVYFIRMTAGSFTDVRKIVLLK